MNSLKTLSLISFLILTFSFSVRAGITVVPPLSCASLISQQDSLVGGKCACESIDQCLHSYDELRKDVTIAEAMKKVKAAMDKVPADELGASGDCKSSFSAANADESKPFYAACRSLRHTLNELVKAKSNGKCLIQNHYDKPTEFYKESYQKLNKTLAFENAMKNCSKSDHQNSSNSPPTQ